MKRIVGVALFILSLIGLAALYVSGVASVSNLIARRSSTIVGGETASPPDAGWVLIGESEHFAYFSRPGDTIPNWVFGMHETVLSQASELLGIPVPGRIRYFKYASQADLHNATGQRSTGVTRLGDQGIEVHSTRRYHPHEVAHAVVHQRWYPPAFLDEGLATLYGWDWDIPEPDVHAHAYGLLQEGRLVAVETILTDWGFRRYRTYPAYSVAGSFVKYLLDTRDQDRIRSLFELDRYSRHAQIEDAFLSAYGESIYEAEREWRDTLASGKLSPAPSASVPGAGRVELLLSGAALIAVVFLVSAMAIIAGERLVAGLPKALRGLLPRAKTDPTTGVLVPRNGEHLSG